MSDPSAVVPALERLLGKARDTGLLAHPGVVAARDALQSALANGGVTIELDATGVIVDGALVWQPGPEERAVLMVAHRDGLRRLVLPQRCPTGDLDALAECLSRAARRARTAPFDAQSLLGEKLFTALRWANDSGTLRGGAEVPAAQDAPDAWFFGEALPVARLEDLKPLKKREP